MKISLQSRAPQAGSLFEQTVYLVQVPDIVVDAKVLRGFESFGVIPAGHDARIVSAAHIARE